VFVIDVAEVVVTVAMSTSEREQLRAVIEAERVQTLAQVVASQRDFDAIVEASAASPPDDEHDPDGSTTAFERAQVAALLSHAQDHVVELDRALERLDADTFGACDTCERPIAIERLLARPTALNCMDCATAAAPWPLRPR